MLKDLQIFFSAAAFMKMKKILIYVFALLLAAPGWSREFYRLGGLTKVRIIKVTHRGILVSHTEGICNLDLKKLSAQDKKDLEKELLELQQKKQQHLKECELRREKCNEQALICNKLRAVSKIGVDTPSHKAAAVQAQIVSKKSEQLSKFTRIWCGR
ncbi:MAG: hypothetical protein E7044_03670 [Lentisphaerae bacterium]|nr:hypothetical protein [Lentisphaerota bacterium]